MRNRDFRPSERKSKTNVNPLEVLEGLLWEDLAAAYDTLVYPTVATMRVIKWDYDTDNDLGAWDADTNSPTLASGVGGELDWYTVSVAGSTPLDGISTWPVGARLQFIDGAWIRVDDGENELRRDARFYLTEQTVSVTNRSIDLVLESRTYVIVMRISGEWRIIWADCGPEDASGSAGSLESVSGTVGGSGSGTIGGSGSGTIGGSAPGA